MKEVKRLLRAIGVVKGPSNVIQQAGAPSLGADIGASLGEFQRL